MPLLTELGDFFGSVFYKYSSPTGFAEMDVERCYELFEKLLGETR
jgi:hypothetical protein